VACQDGRSQHQNRERALTILRSRLLAQEKEKIRLARTEERRTMIGTGDRSEKIRTYNFPQDRVTDHRLKKSWHGINEIMNGELEKIIDSFI
jgi:peptide chain release factor 1